MVFGQSWCGDNSALESDPADGCQISRPVLKAFLSCSSLEGLSTQATPNPSPGTAAWSKISGTTLRTAASKFSISPLFLSTENRNSYKRDRELRGRGAQ